MELARTTLRCLTLVPFSTAPGGAGSASVPGSSATTNSAPEAGQHVRNIAD